jgi:hypothetical protein
MSSDYRPRGGSNSGDASSSGRRRRGGRGRGGAGRSSSGEHRSHSNGHSYNGTHSSPAKKKGPIAAFFSWITGGGKKKGDHSRPMRSMVPASENAGPDRPRSDRTERPDRSDRGERTERGPRPERAERSERPDRPARTERPEPEPQEITTPKLYVGNLAYEAGESDLFDLFSKVGHVKNVEIAMDRRANRSKGFGFVEMEVLETAKEAAEKLNRTDFMGRQIVVSGAKMERSRVNPPEESASESHESSESTPSSSSEESSL